MSKTTLRRVADSGEVACWRTSHDRGAHRRFDPADVERFRRQMGRTATPPD